jgi:hypothetical protein
LYFRPHSLYVSPLLFIRVKRGREGCYPCPVMTQG